MRPFHSISGESDVHLEPPGRGGSNVRWNEKALLFFWRVLSSMTRAPVDG